MLLLGDIPELEDFEGDILLTKVQKAMITPLHQDVAAVGVWLCGLKKLFLITSHLILVRSRLQLSCFVIAEPSATQAKICV